MESFDIYNYLLSYNVRLRQFTFQFDDKIIQYFHNAAATNSPEIIVRANILKKLGKTEESIYEMQKNLLTTMKILKSDKDTAYNLFASLTSFCREKERKVLIIFQRNVLPI
jgi:hypothetical protein